MIFDDTPLIFKKEFKGVQVSNEDLKKINIWTDEPSESAIFTGEPGRGKSHAAFVIAKQTSIIIRKKFPDFYYQDNFCFCVLSELNQYWVSHVTESYEMLRRLINVTCLVIDDLGVRSPSEGFLDFLYAIINGRINNKSPTIYTTNLNSKEINSLYGPRMVSRIYSGLKIEFTGKDLRLK